MAGRKLRAGRILPFAVLAGVLSLSLVGAAGGAAAAEAVAVDVGVVLASNSGKDVDPALGSLRPKLDAMFRYSSYRILDRRQKSLGAGEEGVFELPGNRAARIVPASSSGNKVRLAVQVTEGSKSLLSTTVGMNRGGMVLLGGFPFKDGVMILFISAR